MDTMILTFAILIFLITLIDIKTKRVPSILLSGLLLVAGILNFSNISYGLLALTYAWFLIDSDFIKGMGDVKVIGIIGLFISNLHVFFLFMILIVFYGVVYKWCLLFIMKEKENSEIPFIPVLFMTFITLIILWEGWFLWVI